MKNSRLIPSLLILILSSCNLYGGLSKPSGDEQILLAARACLDQGNYDCAKTYYAALSANYNDYRLSEGGFTTLASNGIFTMRDLVSSLGTSTGNGSSMTSMANIISANGKFDSATRTTIQTVFSANTAITDAHTKAFAQFFTAMTMFNSVLAAAGNGGLVAESTIVTSTACKTDNACIANAHCAIGTGTNLTFNAGDTATSMSSSTGWTTSPTVQKLIVAATEASNQLTALTGQSNNYSGLLKTIQTLSNISGSEPCIRQALVQTLFP